MIRESAADVHEARRMRDDSIVVSLRRRSGTAVSADRSSRRASTTRTSARAQRTSRTGSRCSSPITCSPAPTPSSPRNLWDVPGAPRDFARFRTAHDASWRVVHMVMADALPPIGVFDSGIGGLTVAHEVIRQLPHESIIYFGDTARVPYGPKSPGHRAPLQPRDRRHFFAIEGVKSIVIACNTATAHALAALRDEMDMPVIGVVEPGARAAVAATRGGHIGVIGTAGTIKSGAYERAIRALDPDVIDHAARLSAVRSARRRRLDRSRGDAPRRARVSRADARRRRSTRSCSAARTIRCSSRCCATCSARDVRLIDSAEETAAETARTLASAKLARGRCGRADAIGSSRPTIRYSFCS